MIDCRIPRTSTRRGAICYAKLLVRVDPNARDGFGFEGRFLKPGEKLEVAELGPAVSPILLESTEVDSSYGARRRKIYARLYILWRFDRPSAEWIELARCQAVSSEWAEQLREPARIALGRASWTVGACAAEVAGQIRGLLERQWGALEAPDRRLVLAELAELHDQLTCGLVETAADVV